MKVSPLLLKLEFLSSREKTNLSIGGFLVGSLRSPLILCFFLFRPSKQLPTHWSLKHLVYWFSAHHQMSLPIYYQSSLFIINTNLLSIIIIYYQAKTLMDFFLILLTRLTQNHLFNDKGVSKKTNLFLVRASFLFCLLDNYWFILFYQCKLVIFIVCL